MKSETEKLFAKGAFEIVSRKDLPPGAETVPTRFVFAVKRSGKLKSRLVAQGHRQDYDIIADNSSPTADLASLKLLLQHTVQKGWDLRSVDFEIAYLNAGLPTEVFASAPNGFSEVRPDFDPKTHALRLKKCLYGLRASGALWNKHLATYLQTLKFRPGTFDPCLFAHESRELVLLIYVDDLLIAGMMKDIDWICQKFRADYAIQEAPLDDFLSLRIQQHHYQETKTISLDLANYIKATVDELGLTDCRPAPTPLPSRYDLAPAASDDDLLDASYRFNRFLGKLLWITKTRSDIAFAANVLSRVAHRPTLAAWKIMKRVFRYLAGNFGKKLWFKPV